MQWLKKVLLIGLVIAIYFIGIRPLRGILVKHFLYPVAKYEIKRQKGSIIIYNKVMIAYSPNLQNRKKIGASFRIDFGGFFLLSVIALIILQINWKWVGGLLWLHLFFLLIGITIFFTGLNGHPGFLQGIGLLKYLIPAFSFGLVAFAWVMESHGQFVLSPDKDEKS